MHFVCDFRSLRFREQQSKEISRFVAYSLEVEQMCVVWPVDFGLFVFEEEISSSDLRVLFSSVCL